MKILSQRTKGLTVFKDTVEINYRDLPEGLIAITGPNGGGKTSLMEAFYASLYRELPSRKETLPYYCSGKDAFLESEFQIGPNIYRSKVLINAHTGDQKAFLECNGQPLDECRQGKLLPHAKAVERIVGSSRLFLSSVFSAQSRKGTFSEMPVAERKTLFIELLGLGQFPEYEKKAKARLEQSTVELSSKRVELNLLTEKQFRLTELAAEVDALKQWIAETEPGFWDAKRLLDEISHQEAEWKAKATALEAEAIRRREELQKRSEQLRGDNLLIHRKIEHYQEQLRAKGVERERETNDLRTRIADVEKRIANNEELLKRSTEITAAVAREQDLKATLERLDSEYSLANDQERRILQYQGIGSRLDAEWKALEATITAVEEEADELKEVPCNAEGIYSACIKITNAVSRRRQLPELQSKRKDLERERAHVQLRIQQNGYRPTKDILNERESIQAELNRIAGTVKLVAAIETAQERIDEHRRALKDTQGRLSALLEHATEPDPLLQELEERAATLTREKIDVDRALKTVLNQPEMDEIRPRLGQLRKEIERLELEVKTTDIELRQKEIALKAAEAEAEQLRKAIEGSEALRTDADKLSMEIQDWTMIQRACGKEGIPALEIDAAGPAVSLLVNELLASCFSTRFTVELRTQKAAKSGDRMLEDFNIRCFDSLLCRDGTLDDLSGGEKVIVSEALAMAIGLYNKSSCPHETCWRDETTGALAIETAPLYVQMLRRAMQLGNYSRIIFVTHNRDCAQMSDVQIECNGGKVAITIA